ncbi:2-succinyl-5-enolpyruvyl-6-hydroxy-3-cyclohexene-1-carboxylic-acid synthase [Microbacterium trichothecenolyticum]|uniref:2-succinyl-5-enolpyruvyl-6-hydroxy-3- cyclohexene-1-carboxylic-acid synthase n=1 Tax=Microbacterium trichothecenolyticum TaxID=69370 RepID=UPI001C6EB789|nr:2-succinyl-5-enolpyruvyl-6-hydroxy-3-cyclohexene-1-carboxylic-acid synthase [Microbacterium trichothecenolyticum]MBW9122399.1 2-succinyl-5-enolpyruvyl-6-hydroxy-3-cyclohexene-1-carboxylic-acid synthase [Microbacterium trichothecenolyticum]
MYANDPLVLELLALLKAHDVRNIVISPGSRHYAFTRSFENDDFFTLHSVVDERSAAFYALGLIQATGFPAATICTSGTAAANYGSAVAEAYYQKLPLVVLTTDRLPEYLNQMEDQMFDQTRLFEGFTRHTAHLRPIMSARDAWYCNRVINEALIECKTGGGGPVHVNIPLESHTGIRFTAKTLPKARVIVRHNMEVETPDWRATASRLRKKKVLLVWGQGPRPDGATLAALDDFTSTFDCVVLADHLANLHQDRRVENPLSYLKSKESKGAHLQPDLVLTVGGNIVFKDELKNFLKDAQFEHWRIDPDGGIADPFRKLTNVFPTEPRPFLQAVTSAAESRSASVYAERTISAAITVPAPEAPHGELATIGVLLRSLPKGSALHIANSAPIRMTQLFEIDDSIDVFCNRGVNGIDGCMSTAIGYAAAVGRPTYLIIGDLTFFYDMNSLWIRHLPDNLRILLLNNEGGAIMHSPLPASYTVAAQQHVTAGHNTTAQGWVQSLSIDYRPVMSADGLTDGISWLTDPFAGSTRLLEVFTEKVSDIHQLKSYYLSILEGPGSNSLWRRGMRFAKKVLRRLGIRR